MYKIDKDKKELIERAEDFEQMAMKRLEKVGGLKRGEERRWDGLERAEMRRDEKKRDEKTGKEKREDGLSGVEK